MKLKLALGATLAGCLLVPAGASASFHLTKVTEVYPGFSGDPDAELIELQMYAPGQNLVGGHTVFAYGPGGSEEYTFAGKVANGDNQRTILLASPEAEAEFGVEGDLEIEKHVLEASSGAVCFETIDCVAWGSFADAVPGLTGANAPAIPAGRSLQRSISAGCPTLLEAGDDTGDSAADFLAGVPTPRANGTVPTERECVAPETTITKAPGKRTKKKRARFRFTSDVAGASFQCKLDRGRFKPCKSPKTYRHLKRGRHVFKVRASAAGETDASPAKHRWTRKKPRRKRRR